MLITANIAAIGLGVIASTATGSVEIRLEATVAVACSIESVEVVASRPDQLYVASNCNAETFQIRFDGSPASVIAAQAVGASASSYSSAVRLRSDRPGRIDTIVTFDQAIEAHNAPEISLATF